MGLKDFATSPTSSASDGRGPLPVSVPLFVSYLADNSVRIAYGALALLVHAVNGNPVAKRNDGQTGTSLTRKLPKALQPMVCKSGGSYSPEAVEAWDEAGIEYDLVKLGKMSFLKSKDVLGAYNEWAEELQAAAAKKAEEDETEDDAS